MTRTHTVKPNELEAIALGASHESTRYYLCGVCFETYEDKSGAMITTNGHRLMSVHAKQADTPEHSFILTNEDVAKALKIAKGEKRHTGAKEVAIQITTDDYNSFIVSVVWLDAEGEVAATVGSFSTKPIDGNFPDWRRVVPALPLTGPVANSIGFNGLLMADFAKASKLLGNRSAVLEVVLTGKESPILINIPENDNFYKIGFIGVLMSHRV